MMMALMLQVACHHHHHPPFQSHQGKSRHHGPKHVWAHYHFQCHHSAGLPRTKEIEQTWSGKNGGLVPTALVYLLLLASLPGLVWAKRFPSGMASCTGIRYRYERK